MRWSSEMAKEAAETSSLIHLQQPQPWHGVGGIVNNWKGGVEAASAEFKQAWTPTAGVLQQQAKELFELAVLFFRKSGKTPKAQVSGKEALTSFRSSGIFPHKAFRKFLAETQRPFYAGVKWIFTFCEASPEDPLPSWVMTSVTFSTLP